MITIPTRSSILSDLLSSFKTKWPNADTSLGQFAGALAYMATEALIGLHTYLYRGLLDVWPTKDTSWAGLIKHATARFGPDPDKKASVSRGTDALQVTGTLAGAAVVAGDTLSYTDGSRFKLTTGGTVGLGTAVFSVESITKGSDVNLLTGDTLTFESPPANIEADATLVKDLTGGYDAETQGELLQRTLQDIRNPKAGGRASDYLTWALAIDGVASAYVYCPSSSYQNGRRGMGVADVAILVHGSGADRIPDAILVQDVQDYIDTLYPCTAKEVLVLTPAAVEQDIEIAVTLGTGYEWDWTAAVGGHQVAAYAAKVITWSTAIPATMQSEVDAGRQPLIHVAGQVFTVTAYNAGLQQTTISETPETDPVAPDEIYPSCAVAQNILEAVIAYCDTLGPARGNAPDPSQDYWDDTLRLSKLFAACVQYDLADGTTSGVQGCGEIDIVSPVANVTPTDHAPAGTVDLIVYAVGNDVAGNIIIRPA